MIYVWLLICVLLGPVYKPSDAEQFYEGTKEVQQKQNNNVILLKDTAVGSYPLNLRGLQELANETLSKYMLEKRKSKRNCMSSLCIVFFTIYISYLWNILL